MVVEDIDSVSRREPRITVEVPDIDFVVSLTVLDFRRSGADRALGVPKYPSDVLDTLRYIYAGVIATTEKDGPSPSRKMALQYANREDLSNDEAGHLLRVIVWMAFLNYNSLIVVRTLGGTPFQAGMLAAIGNLVFAFIGSQAGRIASYLWPLLIGDFLLVVGLIAVFFAPNIAGASLGIVAGVGFEITIPSIGV